MVSKKVADRRLAKKRAAQSSLGLPEEIWRDVADRLDLVSLVNLRRTCLFLLRVATDSRLYKKFAEVPGRLEALLTTCGSGTFRVDHRPWWSRKTFRADYFFEKREDMQYVDALGVALPVYRKVYGIPTTHGWPKKTVGLVLGLIKTLEIYDITVLQVGSDLR